MLSWCTNTHGKWAASPKWGLGHQRRLSPHLNNSFPTVYDMPMLSHVSTSYTCTVEKWRDLSWHITSIVLLFVNNQPISLWQRSRLIITIFEYFCYLQCVFDWDLPLLLGLGPRPTSDIINILTFFVHSFYWMIPNGQVFMMSSVMSATNHVRTKAQSPSFPISRGPWTCNHVYGSGRSPKNLIF